MSSRPTVDVAINIFARPYQTALSLLSLLHFSGQHIDRIYMQFEPKGSRFDHTPPYCIADYLHDQAIISQPEHWLEIDATNPARLQEQDYRMSIRYEHAFENSDKKYLFIMHNDVLITKDIIGMLLDNIGESFVAGQIGQCWNCPAANAELMQECGYSKPCFAPLYAEFKPSFTELQKLYALAQKRGVFVRPYWEGWEPMYSPQAWPLPECRVNEWGCLVDLEQTRQHVIPVGKILPFGSFEFCGSIALDTAVAWFRELNRLGLRAKHVDIQAYLKHWVGSHRTTRDNYLETEQKAWSILLKSFKPFVDWCREQKNGMFD